MSTFTGPQIQAAYRKASGGGGITARMEKPESHSFGSKQPEIVAYDKKDNLSAAETFRAILDDRESSAEPERYRSTSMVNPHGLIDEAYRREFTPAHPLRHFAITYPSDVERKVFLPPQVNMWNDTTAPPDPRRRGRPLLLPGLGQGRQRNEYGKALGGGQESGIGVIGSSAMGEDHTTALHIGETGCDIPASGRYGIKRSPSSHGITTPPEPHYHVSLDPYLPPLAVEHPARVWNVMLHSLSPEHQPVIKWDYTRVEVSENIGLVAHLTLILPRTHPVLTEHPLLAALPSNQWMSEYTASAEAIGAAKKWSGEPRQLKADAQNSALVKCIAEDALSWLRAPVMAAVPIEDNDNEEGCRFPVCSEVVNPHELRTVHDELLAANTVQWPPTPTSHPMGGSTRPDPETSPGQQPPPPPTNPLAAFLQTLRDLEDDMDLTEAVKLRTTWYPVSTNYSADLQVGTHPHVQAYEDAQRHPTASEAQEAVCEKALDLNVQGFLHWLVQTQQGGSSNKITAACDSQTHVGHTKLQDQEVLQDGATRDWQQQLFTFCPSSGLSSPRDTQGVARVPDGPTLLQSRVPIENEPFSFSKAFSSVPQAHQKIGRTVCVNRPGGTTEESEGNKRRKLG